MLWVVVVRKGCEICSVLLMLLLLLCFNFCRQGILKSESKAGNTGSTNFSQTETESTVESLGPPPSYHTVDKSPPPSYSRIDEEVLMYVPLESETNQHSGSIVR